MQSVAGGASSIESITLSSVMLDDGRTMVRRKETKLRNGRVLIRDSPIFVAPKRLDHNDVSQGPTLQERPETIPDEALLPLVHHRRHDDRSLSVTRKDRENGFHDFHEYDEMIDKPSNRYCSPVVRSITILLLLIAILLFVLFVRCTGPAFLLSLYHRTGDNTNIHLGNSHHHFLRTSPHRNPI